MESELFEMQNVMCYIQLGVQTTDVRERHDLYSGRVIIQFSTKTPESYPIPENYFTS